MKRVGAVFVTSLVAACGFDLGGVDEVSFEDVAQSLVAEGSPEALGALSVANDCRNTFAVLDNDAGLRSDAARQLVKRRDGSDRRCGTSDDHRFSSIADLDATRYVGQAAIDKLVSFARKLGLIPATPSAAAPLKLAVSVSEPSDSSMCVEISGESGKDIVWGVRMDDYTWQEQVNLGGGNIERCGFMPQDLGDGITIWANYDLTASWSSATNTKIIHHPY